MKPLILVLTSLAGISAITALTVGARPVDHAVIAEPLTTVATTRQTVGDRIAAGAQAVVARQPRYYETYEKIDYPGGDVPADYGVCTDLVVRAFRTAHIDLQELLHEDRVKNPSAYPTELWEHKKPDANIDHRRCQNLAVFLSRKSTTLTNSTAEDSLSQWHQGDVVFFTKKRAKHPWHVAIISGQTDKDAMPMIYHLFPPHAQMDRLDEYGSIGGHYRWK